MPEAFQFNLLQPLSLASELLNQPTLPHPSDHDYCITVAISSNRKIRPFSHLGKFAYVYHKPAGCYFHGIIQTLKLKTPHRPYVLLNLQSPLYFYQHLYEHLIFNEKPFIQCLRKLLNHPIYRIKLNIQNTDIKHKIVHHAVQLKYSNYHFMQQLCETQGCRWQWDLKASTPTLLLADHATPQSVTTPQSVMYQHPSQSSYSMLQYFQGPTYALSIPFPPNRPVILTKVWKQHRPMILCHLETQHLKHNKLEDHTEKLAQPSGFQLQFSKKKDIPSICFKTPSDQSLIALYQKQHQKALQINSQTYRILMKTQKNQNFKATKNLEGQCDQKINITAENHIQKATHTGDVLIQTKKTYQQSSKKSSKMNAANISLQGKTIHAKSQEQLLKNHTSMTFKAQHIQIGTTTLQHLHMLANTRIVIIQGNSKIILSSQKIEFKSSKIIIHAQHFTSSQDTYIK